jgi:hypothetical protein
VSAEIRALTAAAANRSPNPCIERSRGPSDRSGQMQIGVMIGPADLPQIIADLG